MQKLNTDVPVVPEMFLLKMGELVLKGLNRKTFEQRLMGNLQRRLYPYGQFRTYSRQSIAYVEPMNEDCDLDGAWEGMQKIFGFASLSRARACRKDKDAFFEAVKNYLHEDLMNARTFKVESKRSDKHFPMTSIELSQYVGGLIAEAYPHLTVDVHNPELVVHLEVRDFAGYVHANAAQGAGGLPVGSAGRAVALLSGGLDSPVACYMMAKRGLALEMVHFFSYPYTSEEAKEKVLDLAKLISPYCGRLTVNIVPFTSIQEDLRRNCPEPYFTIAMRRYMMRISEMVADRVGAHALVTGESLGQVASQTMEAMECTGAVCRLPVFRPVIGMDKEEIVKIARKIGTFETSILPYEDCCTVFTPRHPRTHPKVSELEEIEKNYNWQALCQEAFDHIERIQIRPQD
ncbi:MAG: tRNA 4-thiouridine(8) synthase ThiI [Oscillospiraceae bacterium]|nr:tRNA 4-thiouridine(8) synthase ThiI [Oscillospiraceae bacterium]